MTADGVRSAVAATSAYPGNKGVQQQGSAVFRWLVDHHKAATVAHLPRETKQCGYACWPSSTPKCCACDGLLPLLAAGGGGGYCPIYCSSCPVVPLLERLSRSQSSQ